jgi:hypothetical protein
MNDSQAEYFRHPISLSPNYAISPASLGKAYLREMNIHIPKIHVAKGLGLTEEEILGLAMTTYFGGRAECHIRRIVVPVTYCDFKSMYPTVNALMGLWAYLTAEWIYVEDATDEVMEYLERIGLDDMYNPETWRHLPVLVEVKTDRDILPVRTNFSKSKKGSLTLGLNRVSSTLLLCFTLADVVASKLLVGKGTRIIRAIRFRPLGKQNEMNTIKVLGSIPVDPHYDDFFKVLVEARHRIKGEMAFDLAQQKRIEKSLKAIVNSTSYGILLELIRRAREKTQVDVYGYEHFNCEVEDTEIPGQFFFPILGTLLTSGARLMLATLEAELNRQGGTHAFMDTDSAAIVSSALGGMIPCKGGPNRLPEGREAIQALSWKEVDEIRNKFVTLNPYDQKVVLGSILELENENFIEDKVGRQIRVEVSCFAIASKRYILFYKDNDDIHLLKFSEHGLGNYLPPDDPETGKPVPDWIEQGWLYILGQEGITPSLPSLSWGRRLVRTRVRISTPEMMEWFARLNALDPSKEKSAQKPYPQTVKPFNMLEHVVVPSVAGFQAGTQVPVCLVSPADIKAPENRTWINTHQPNARPCRVISSPRQSYGPQSLPGLTYVDLIEQYRYQPETKFLGPDGEVCGTKTRGVLNRRQIEIIDVVHIGKETNELEMVQAGLVEGEEAVLLKYERDLWEYVQPILSEIPARMVQEETGYSRRMAYALKRGDRRPSEVRMADVLRFAAKHARERLTENGHINLPGEDEVIVKLYIHYLASC